MNNINYTARDFQSIRTELYNFIAQYYPNITDFSDSSIGSMLVELNAAVADNLSFNIDRTFQETQLQSVQERKNVLALARTFGLNVPGKRASITIVDFSAEVPIFGDSFDTDYLPIIRAGAQVSGAGKVFETVDDIDFLSSFNSSGNPNRIVIPNINANEKLTSYTITKRELVINGTTKIQKKVISGDNYKPFIEITLPDLDVLSIEQVISLDGVSYTSNPVTQDFLAYKNRFYEVEALAQNELFLEVNNVPTGNKNLKTGRYADVSKRFIREFNDKGFCKLIFGGGSSNAEMFDSFVNSIGLNLPFGKQYLNNNSLGEIPKANSTIFIRYRVGGGSNSNVGLNVLNSVGNIEIFVNGPRADYNNMVINSLRVNNPIPAIGGNDGLSVEQIRNLIAYNYSSQNRCVTLRDYLSQIYKMPSKFGAPFRVSVHESQNKIAISILGLDENGKLDNQSNNILKNNIAEYLSNYRMLNDFIEIEDGRIVNLSFEFNLLIDKAFSKNEIIATAINVVNNYLSINNRDMNQNIYIGNLIELVNNINGVINVVSIKAFNKVGGKYSNNEIAQQYINTATREIEMIDYTLFGEENSMYEIKYMDKDISFLVKQI